MQDPSITTVNRNETARSYCLVLFVSLLGSFAMGCGPTAPVVEDTSEEGISTAVMDTAVLDAQLDELLKVGQDDGIAQASTKIQVLDTKSAPTFAQVVHELEAIWIRVITPEVLIAGQVRWPVHTSQVQPTYVGNKWLAQMGIAVRLDVVVVDHL